MIGTAGCDMGLTTLHYTIKYGNEWGLSGETMDGTYGEKQNTGCEPKSSNYLGWDTDSRVLAGLIKTGTQRVDAAS